MQQKSFLKRLYNRIATFLPMKDKILNNKSLIFAALLFLGCVALGLYSCHIKHEMSQYRHLYRYHMICLFDDYYKKLEAQLGVPVSTTGRINLPMHQPFSASCLCPAEKEAALTKELQQTEQELELQLADWHGYICPDLVLTVSKRPPKEKETSGLSESYIVYELSLHFAGFRTPTPEEQRKVWDKNIHLM